MQTELVNPLTPANPVTLVRLDKTINSDAPLSLSQIARAAGVSESTLLRTEQGLYHDIPPVILRYLSNYFISPTMVTAMYYRFQHHQRAKVFNDPTFPRYYRGLLTTAVIYHPDENPFILWREKILGYNSRLAFCKGLCLHPSTVKRIEDGIATTIPDVLVKILTDAGINVGPLVFHYESWKDKTSKISKEIKINERERAERTEQTLSETA